MKTIDTYDKYFNPAYDRCNLNHIVAVHKDIFEQFLSMDKNFYSLVNTYMRTSEPRYGADHGWNGYMDRTAAGYLHQVDFSQCLKKGSEPPMDQETAKKIAEIYCNFQWMYSMDSREIIERIPAEKLAAVLLQEPALCKLPVIKICSQLYRDFCSDKIEEFENKPVISPKTSGYEFLSNDYEAPFTTTFEWTTNEFEFHKEDFCFRNVTSAYYACIVSDEEKDKREFENTTADEARELIQKKEIMPWHGDYVRSEMGMLIDKKFKEHPEFMEKLLETGDSRIYVPFDWKTSNWLAEDNNLVGNIIMYIREAYQKDREQDVEKEQLITDQEK